MITLGPTQSLAAVAGTGSVLTCTVYGAIKSGLPASIVYRQLYQGQLATMAATLFAATAQQQILIKTIKLRNGSAATVSGVRFMTSGIASGNETDGTISVPANGMAIYEDGAGWMVYDGQGRPISVVVSVDDTPVWAGAKNPGAVVSATTPENVVDSRSIPGGTLASGQIVEAVVQAFIPATATNGMKNLRVCIDADDSNSILASFDASVQGTVTTRFRFMVRAASPHLSISTVDLNNNAHWFQQRGESSVDLAATAVNLETRAWVANASDSIVIDSINVKLHKAMP